MPEINYPFISNSWVVVSKDVAIKKLDKAAFIYNETGIPKDISFFFELQDMIAREKKLVQLTFNHIAYEAYFYKDPSSSLRTKILWKDDLAEQIGRCFVKVVQDIIKGYSINKYNEPLMEFIKLDGIHYEVILRYRGHQIEC